MLVNGNKIAEEIYKEIGEEFKGKKVCFVSFLKSAESRIFMEKKKGVTERLGIVALIREEEVDTTGEAKKIIYAIADEGYDGVVIQLPLPKHFDAQEILDALPENLDIDMLGAKAKESYRQGLTKRVPPVAGAVQEIFNHHHIDLQNKKIVILGKGRLVGEPVMLMLERLGLNYENFDINTPQEIILESLSGTDIIISGMGTPHFIKSEMVKGDSVLIDAGTSEYAGKLVGDIDPQCAEKAAFITLVPGGIGPITIAALFRNLA